MLNIPFNIYYNISHNNIIVLHIEIKYIEKTKNFARHTHTHTHTHDLRADEIHIKRRKYHVNDSAVSHTSSS